MAEKVCYNNSGPDAETARLVIFHEKNLLKEIIFKMAMFNYELMKKLCGTFDKSYSIKMWQNGKLIYKYDGPGFNETVDWYIKWLSENEILLYYHSSNERYNEEYHIIID